jgi:hypothetical protein
VHVDNLFLSWEDAVTTYADALNTAHGAVCTPRSGRVTSVSTRSGVSAILDEEDKWATLFRWHSHVSGQHKYLCTTFGVRHVMLHALILPTPATWPGVEQINVHHVDGDTLNNRRFNLRYLTHSESVALGKERRRNDR